MPKQPKSYRKSPPVDGYMDREIRNRREDTCPHGTPLSKSCRRCNEEYDDDSDYTPRYR